MEKPIVLYDWLEIWINEKDNGLYEFLVFNASHTSFLHVKTKNFTEGLLAVEKILSRVIDHKEWWRGDE